MQGKISSIRRLPPTINARRPAAKASSGEAAILAEAFATCRCVRRAFLCGRDKDSGKDYEHRRQWIIERIALLSRAFAIEIVGYSIMSSHYHLIVRLNPEQADAWSDQEILDRWSLLYGMPVWLLDASPMDTHMQAVIATWIRKRRGYLQSLSWLMKCLNEHISKSANREDECTGTFWQARFHSQALLDEKALLACMAYVDLNPIRARMAKTPEASDFTSIQQRIYTSAKKSLDHRPELVPFQNAAQSFEERQKALPMSELDYLKLVDDTGRVLARGKSGGTIPSGTLPILECLGFDEKGWMNASKLFGSKYYPVIGQIDAMRVMAKELRDKPRAWYNGSHEVHDTLYRE